MDTRQDNNRQQKRRKPNTARPDSTKRSAPVQERRPAPPAEKDRPQTTVQRQSASGRRTNAPRQSGPTAEQPRRRSSARAEQRKRGESAEIKRETSRKKRTSRRQNSATPEVVYTPPSPFNRSKLLVQLATIVTVVLAISFGISVFFKVKTITVSGTQKYDAWTIKEASGIEIGDNLLSFGEAKAAGKIKTALPYVESVRIGIKLPDTVNIEIKELDVVYAVKDADGITWWLITAEGKVVDKVKSDEAGESTAILGVSLANPVIGQQAVAQEEAPSPTDDTSETAAPVTARASDRLNAALQILQYLEECGIIGEVASVNVEDLGNLELQYGQRFRVKLGDTTQLLFKIKCMNEAINGDDKENTLKEYDRGVLDITFRIKENQVIYQADED